MRVRFGFDFDEAGRAFGLKNLDTSTGSVLMASSAAPALVLSAPAAPVLEAVSGRAFTGLASITTGSASGLASSTFVAAVSLRPVAPAHEFFVPKSLTQSSTSTLNDPFSNSGFGFCACGLCGEGGSGGGGLNSGNRFKAEPVEGGNTSGGFNEGSGPGTSQLLTSYNRDPGTGIVTFSGIQNIDAVLFGSRWTETNITFSFPTSGSFYQTPYYDPGYLTNHVDFNPAQQASARYAFSLVGGYTLLNFTEITETASVHARIRLSQTTDGSLGSAEGNFPGSDSWDGDIWFGSTGQPFYTTPAIGNWGSATIMHEIGHTMGLKHAHDDYTPFDLTIGGYLDGPGPRYGTRAMQTGFSGWAWTVMTYDSDPGNAGNYEGDGFNQPQTFMMYDIAALQFMYGADYTTNSSNSTYTFNTTTGEMFINGVSQGIPTQNAGAGKIFRTIWDGNGVDTYNFSNFTTNQVIDLRPGQWSTMSAARLSDTRPLSNPGVAFAPGNVANALLHNNDTRSLIENANGGSGNDTIEGNTANNVLNGNNGADYLDGDLGNDTLNGGNGNDTIDGWVGNDSLNGDADNDYLLGYIGNDTINGGTGNDTLYGETDNDALNGGAGNDSVFGGDGNDTITDTESMGASDDDVYNGGDGIDTLVHNLNWVSSVTFDLAAGFAIFGGNRDQLISIENLTIGGEASVIGSAVANVITINGSGANAINAGAGNDTVFAGGGNDTITDTNGFEASSSDVYNGGDGIDTLVHDLSWVSTVSFNLATGFSNFEGNGDQLISIENLTIGGSASVVGSSVANVITVNGTGANAIDAGGGTDTVLAGGGNDTITDTGFFDAGNNDVYNGGDGIDTLVHDQSWLSTVSFNLATGFSNFEGNGDQLISIENLTIGGSASVIGSSVANVITVNGTGANAIDAGEGNDTVFAGGGDDTITDSQTIGIADTDDVYNGGDGIDTLIHDRSWVSSVTFDLAAGFTTFNGNRDQLISIENLVIGGSAAVVGSSVANVITVNGTGANLINAGAGNDTVSAGGGNDTVNGGTGNDVITVGSGAGDVNTVDGGADNDLITSSGSGTYLGGTGNDTIFAGLSDADPEVLDGGDGVDLLNTSLYTGFLGTYEINMETGVTNYPGESFINFENLTTGNGDHLVMGTSGDNIITTGNGNDTVDGGTGGSTGGIDTISTGAGNDTIIDTTDTNASFIDVYDGGEGTDTVVYSLAAFDARFVVNLAIGRITFNGGDRDQLINIENVTVENGAGMVGSSGANVLTAIGAFANAINAGAGQDTVNAGAGDDTITDFDGMGGSDDDVYDGGDGIDTLVHDLNWVSDVTFDLAAGFTTYFGNRDQLISIENLVIGGEATVVGSDVANLITINGTGANLINAGDGNDTINAGGGNDTINGGDGVDAIFGGDGNDLIDGGFGTESQDGGAGNDTFFLGLGEGNDSFYGGSGTGDFLDFSALTSFNLVVDLAAGTWDFGAAQGIEQVTTSIGNDTITGDAQANILSAGDGDDSLNGGAGIDILNGGLGNDTFVVDDSADDVNEANELGFDRVVSSVTYTLAVAGRFVEELYLTGSANINGTGNGLNNNVYGNSGNNVLSGLDGSDAIRGFEGNDTLDGGLGADLSLQGGLGDDLYIVDDAADFVEESVGEGTDTVQSSVTLFLVANVENITLTGSANINATGNSLANILTGNSGVNTLSGGLGDDTFYVQNATDNVQDANGEGTDTVITNITYTLAAGGRFVENLTLVGSGAINATGNNLANILRGNSGVNVLTGGIGNDTYVVQNTTDTAVEALNQGTDTVESTVTFTLGANVENLTLIGSAAINGTGNGLANILTGNAGVNALTGGLGNDTYVVQNTTDTAVEVAGQGTDLVQASVNFTLGAEVENLTLTGSANINGTGNAGNNVLIGNTGTNILTGGLGDDTFYIQNAGDNVQDANGQGTDTVISNITYTLAAAGRFVEILDLAGSGNIDGTGNNIANTLLGSNGNNVLNGGLGNDTLTGELGADTFLFLLGSDDDIITDFDDAENDLININAYTGGTVNGGGVTITQSGLHTVINLGGGNTITVLNTTATDPGFLSHIVW